MLSFHLNITDIEQHYKYSENWQRFDDNNNIESVSRIIRTCVNSPIVWFNGVRKSDRFLYADWIVLDFDRGLKLTEALELFENHTHIIGTTKRHQTLIDSEGNKIDRFRVWLKSDERCSNISKYIYNTKILAKEFGSDDQAIDGARKFIPCKNIVSINEGKTIVLREQVQYVKRDYVSNRNKFIPSFIMNMLTHGVEDGKRNYACYTIGKYLGNNGFCEGEIVNMIMCSNVPKNQWCVKEVTEAVKNGMR